LNVLKNRERKGHNEIAFGNLECGAYLCRFQTLQGANK